MSYIGHALCFPIKGRTEVGMVVTINSEDLAGLLAKFQHPSPFDHDALELLILPLKPENVTEKRTHSVKLDNIKEYET